MPGGQREERLRRWVNQKLKRRGTAAQLARHLKRPASWVTMYSAGERDADLDTAAEIGRFFNTRLGAITGEEPLPAEPDEHTKMRPEVQRALKQLLKYLPSLSEHQLRLMVQFVEQMAARPGGASGAAGPQSVPTTVPRSR